MLGMSQLQVLVQDQEQDQRQEELQKLILEQKCLLELELPDGAIVPAIEFWDEVLGLHLLSNHKVSSYHFDCRCEQDSIMIRAIANPQSTMVYKHFSKDAIGFVIESPKAKEKRDFFYDVYDGFINFRNKKEVAAAKSDYYGLSKKETRWLEFRNYI